MRQKVQQIIYDHVRENLGSRNIAQLRSRKIFVKGMVGTERYV